MIITTEQNYYNEKNKKDENYFPRLTLHNTPLHLVDFLFILILIKCKLANAPNYMRADPSRI